MSIVRISNLKKSYPSFELNNISFTLEAGRITGLIGRNGAGKTTTIKSMLNIFALSHGAEVLILDEPTSGLDPFSRDELLEIFERIKQEGVAVFFSTHIITDIEKCADEIVYISHGRIIEALSRDEFRRRCMNEGESLEDAFLRMERRERTEGSGMSHA